MPRHNVFILLAVLLSLAAARPLRAETPRVYVNSLGLEFVKIPAGSFTMGSNDQDAYTDEKPPYTVTISQPFYLGRYEVTQEQWEKVMGTNPSTFKNPKNPVEQVSWEEVREFIRRLNEMEETGQYRLPTEAEWEYAARAGTETRFSFGNDDRQLNQYAWFDENSGDQTKPAGSRRPNPWGLYDMHGNVCEWVGDWYGPYYLAQADDPQGPIIGSRRVYRGGSWYSSASYCRSAFRSYGAPDRRYDYIGFRLALSPGQ